MFKGLKLLENCEKNIEIIIKNYNFKIWKN